MKRFRMLRHTDVSGVSGSGHVADGVIFDDGSVVIRWRTQHRSTVFYADFETAKQIHGHDGKTELDVIDFCQEVGEDPQVFFCVMCFTFGDISGWCEACGAGSASVPMAKSYAESVQKNASSQGRARPCEQAKQETEELYRFRRQHTGAIPGRTVRWKEPEPVVCPGGAWEISQEGPDGRVTSVWQGKVDDETPEEALRRTVDCLPVYAGHPYFAGRAAQ